MDYLNSQIKELIKEWIHDEVDRKILYLRLVNGLSFNAIAQIVKRDPKTVREHVVKQEKELFKHLPNP